MAHRKPASLAALGGRYAEEDKGRKLSIHLPPKQRTCYLFHKMRGWLDDMSREK